MSIRLYVGNLPKEPIDRQELETMFAEAGPTVSTKVIKDRKTGKCRGFAFVTVPTDEVADEFIAKFNGHSFKDTPLKIEKALPRSKNKSNNDDPRPSNTSSSGRKGKKSRRSSGGSSSESGSVQPDPRWADELTKLKEMLATQTSNS